ncbi:hypothetical protein MNO11_15980 [Serratia plymuthica]|uniref:hypothetical protein n=1 Tax=Serratia plymuthica TaxID=82996 RepID=UPI001F52EC01|nr:hypothetical protein [Serratia plymuthica]UNK26343.1 hypothetical protein MNO11_15980 [Serratia plymuthica]
MLLKAACRPTALPIRQMLHSFSRQAKDAVSGADAAADRAEAAADNAQNIVDANTYYITPTDPDGTIAGIAEHMKVIMKLRCCDSIALR